MSGIQRITVDITSLDRKLCAQLFTARLPVVARFATGHQPVESWERLAAWCLHRNDVVDRDRRYDPILFEA